MLLPLKKVKLHTSDIKDIYIDKQILITCSRDFSITIITREETLNIKFNYGYLNTLAYKEPTIFLGTQNGNLILYDWKKKEEKVHKIHKDNISALKVKDNLVLTGSWDNTISLLDKTTQIFSEKTKGSVLSVCFYKEGFLGGLESGNILFFKKENEKYFLSHSLSLHVNPVRDLVLKNTFIKSVSQCILVSDEKRILEYKFFDNFLFSSTEKVTVGDNGMIVCGDVCLGVPVGCFWVVKEVCGNYFLGASDGFLYILKEEGYESIYDESFSDEIFRKEKIRVGNLKGGSRVEEKNQNEFTVSELFSAESGKNEKNEFQEKLSDDFKIENGIIYQKVENKFIALGKMKFDSSFTIEIENQAITVDFNKSENPFDVAERIIKEKKLDTIYKNEIAEFIQKNFKKETKFKYLSTIPKEKVKELIKNYKCESIKKLLDGEKVEIRDVEMEIKPLLGEMRFVALDLVRYFYGNGYKLDINFLFGVRVSDRKEAIAYLRLLTNLYGNVGFNLEVFRGEVNRIYDNRMVDQKVKDDYEFNREASFRK